MLQKKNQDYLWRRDVLTKRKIIYCSCLFNDMKGIKRRTQYHSVVFRKWDKNEDIGEFL